MSRIDEIKERQEKDYYYTDLTEHIEQDGPQRDTDMQWMLDRIAKLENVKEQAQDVISWSDGKEAYSGEVEIDAQLLANLDRAIAALDNADDTATTGETATSGGRE